ncbi:hypothetical protein CFIO01_04424 [Colletotrichum fioriniae PJ7]|uniref:Yippee domain-containing protein n=1 Tax=Colletotrichum fioriniae PJ7 TaxID=1445577 RepID=A0A010RXY8_9PEZI|nr:hypothetical protein CFIO01_04424 [Colletotrichum fioriniae PJ7]
MAPNIVVSRPTFPTYLLPSFNIIPFRRRRSPRRTSSASEAAAAAETASTSPYSTPDASQVPSLSSSPTSSTTDETVTPPNSPPPPTYQDATTTTTTASSIPDILSKSKPTSTTTTANKSTNRNNKATSLARTQPDTLRCSTCSCDIAFSSQIVSKGFTGRYGRAYLIAPTVTPSTSTANSTSSSTTQSAGGANNSKNKGSLANVRIGKCENRQLVTGWHVVADITCVLCSAKLGWKYVDAKELSQKYKVGKFILEVERVVPFRSWEDVVDVRDDEYSDDEDDDVSEDEEAVAEVSSGDGVGSDRDEDGVDRNGDDSGGGDDSAAQRARKDTSDSEVEIVFDSEDEDDLEDMFSGNWDPEVVAKRRSRRVATVRKK